MCEEEPRDTTFIGNQRSSPSGVADLYLALDTQVIKEDTGFEGHFVRSDGFLEPDPFVSSIWLLARGESKIALSDELDAFPAGWCRDRAAASASRSGDFAAGL